MIPAPRRQHTFRRNVALFGNSGGIPPTLVSVPLDVWVDVGEYPLFTSRRMLGIHPPTWCATDASERRDKARFAGAAAFVPSTAADVWQRTSPLTHVKPRDSLGTRSDWSRDPANWQKPRNFDISFHSNTDYSTTRWKFARVKAAYMYLISAKSRRTLFYRA